MTSAIRRVPSFDELYEDFYYLGGTSHKIVSESPTKTV
jgi:hypothetical protein